MKRWEERIEAARERRVLGVLPYPRFTAEDREHAANWATCAVGEVRRRYGVRMDRTLGALGVRFYRAVLWNRIERAAELREAIDTHALMRKREQWEQERAGVTPAAEVTPAAAEMRPAA
jgi:hypothetical protein